MTDAAPSREWPPASVWLLALPLFGPPAALIGRAAARGWYDLVCVGGVLVVLGALLFRGVLAGRPTGPKVLGWVAVCVGVVCAVAMVIQSVRGNYRGAVEGVPGVAWVAAALGLRLWPENCRWCGLLPPAEPDG